MFRYFRVTLLVAEKDPEGDQIGYHYSAAEIRAAVDEAHKAGVAVAIHVFGGAAAQAAIDAGVDSIEHGWDLSDAQLAQMKAKGIFLCGTEIPREQLTGWLGPREADAMAKKFIDRLNRARRIGVKLAFGTDLWYDIPGHSRDSLAMDFLPLWSAAGIPPTEILRAMTSDAAKLLRVDRERGRIAPSLAADLVAMPSDPLSNIEALKHIDFVMKDGKVVRSH